MRGSTQILIDTNPVLDEGSLTSTGKVYTAKAICEIMGIQLTVAHPHRNCEKGWGINENSSLPIISTWELTILDMYGDTVGLCFDLTKDCSSLIIGLNVQRLLVRSFLDPVPSTDISRPSDKTLKTIPIYISETEPLMMSAHAHIIGIHRTSESFLVSNHPT